MHLFGFCSRLFSKHDKIKSSVVNYLMEVFNISLDDNEADTSQDEIGKRGDEPRRILQNGDEPKLQRIVCEDNGNISELFKEWERPPEDGTVLFSSSPYEAQPEPFQFLFMDSVSTVSQVRNKSIEWDDMSNKEVTESSWFLHPVIRLFGVARAPIYSDTLEGIFQNCGGDGSFSDKHTFSVCCNVHGFVPYFYGLPTLEIKSDSSEFVSVIDELETELNKAAVSMILEDLSFVDTHEFVRNTKKVIVRIEGAALKDVENSIFLFPGSGIRNKESIIFKIFVALPMFLPSIARLLNNLKVNGNNSECCQPCQFEIFENTLSNNVRFLSDQDIPGCTWLVLKEGKYFKRIPGYRELECESHCQIELDVHYTSIGKVLDPPTGIPPLRILSFDLECRVIPDVTPSQALLHSGQQVIQIGTVVSSYSSTDSRIIGKAAFVIGTCNALSDAKVIQFYDKSNPNDNTETNLLQSEALMMASFRDFLIQMDPDIVTGYNIKNFDLPCLLGRAEKLSSEFEEVKRFIYLGRLKRIRTSTRPILNESKKLYSYDKNLANIQGRIIMDMYPLFIRHTIGRCLKLKFVSKHYLKAGEEKDDVKYTEINALQEGDAQARRRLAKYCVQDSYLPIKLMLIHMPDRTKEKKNFLEYYFELSQLAGTILRYLVNKSKEYNKYFKQVRVLKNNGRVQYHPDSPSPKKIHNSGTLANPSNNRPSSTTNISAKRKCVRMLFTDE